MTEDELKQINAAAVELSVDLGVPRHLYEGSPKLVDWRGRFAVRINGRDFSMVITPMTLLVNDSDPAAPVALMTGAEWIDSPLGRIFHVDYLTHRVKGGFQVFRKADSSPFAGFEEVHHTHMLVYTDGSGEKQFFPVHVDFMHE